MPQVLTKRPTAITGTKMIKNIAKVIHRFFWPKTIPGLLAIFIAIQPAVHYVTGWLIHPTMKEYLKSRGFSEENAKKFSPHNLTIIKPVPQHRGPLDWAHSITEFPSYFGVALSFYIASSPSSGHAKPETFTCAISIEDADKFSSKSFLADRILLIKRNSLRNIPISDEHVHLYLLLHEGSHCDTSKNLGDVKDQVLMRIPNFMIKKDSALGYKTQGFQNEREYHSDTQAVTALKEIFNDNHIQEFVLAFRSVNPFTLLSEGMDYAHDVSLRLDALRKGVKEPTIEDIVLSRKEVATLVKEKLEKKFGKSLNAEWNPKMLIPTFSYKEEPLPSNKIQIVLIQAADEVLKEQGSKLSYYAKRRLELYIDGVRYFAPTVIEESLKQEPKKAPIPSNGTLPSVS